MKYKAQLDNFVTERYDYLREAASRIGGNKEKGDEIFIYLIEWLYSEHPKIENLFQQGIAAVEGYSMKVMYYSIRYTTTINPKVKEIVCSFDEEDWERGEENIRIHESLIEEAFEIYEDGYEEELSLMGLGDDQIEKLRRIRKNYSKLNISMKKLYDLYFEKGMTQREIAKIKKIPYSSCYELIKQLKIELRKN